MAEQQNKPIFLVGNVEDVIYENPKNGYAVVHLITKDGKEITAAGVMPFIGEGEEAKLGGTWVEHPEYGKQFSVTSYEKRLPKEMNAILRYLSSGSVKGIGPVTALKLVNRFGEDTFDILQNHPEWIADIPGISRKKAAEISRGFGEQTGLRDVMMFCREYFNAETTNRICNKWGANAAKLIRDNPYCLCHEFHGIGFERADEIARSFGIAPDDLNRLHSGLLYVLSYNASQNGHACLPEDKLLLAACETLSLPSEKVKEAIQTSITDHTLDAYEQGGVRYIFSASRAADEKYIAEKLLEIDRKCPSLEYADIDRMILRMEQESSITYAPMQKKAIYEALHAGVFILTGGPGTGKTTIVRALLRILDAIGLTVALAAPTGRAAKRMSDATAEEARTLHRMLEMERSEGDLPRFNRDEKHPLTENVIIVDESSMMDLSITAAFLHAVRPGTRLIFIGDTSQLPSVGAGNILGDLLASGCFHSVCLKEIFRQADGSRIVSAAHDIDEGKLPLLDNRGTDLFYLKCDDRTVCPMIHSLINKRLPAAYGDDVRDRIQVITPSRKGSAGTDALNALLRDQLNPAAPSKTELHYRQLTFREGDRVMQTRNNYELQWKKGGQEGAGIFNGDIGVIRTIDPVEERMIIDFDDRVVEYDSMHLDELEHAYAITVHKSQGSEYPIVLFPLYSCPPPLRTRNLLYTAITRAQQMVLLVGRSDILEEMIANDRQVLRYTCLAERLKTYEGRA